MLEILKTYVKEPFFNDLRTLKQLAYYVATVVRVNRGILGMYFLLVSSNADPLSVANQMKEFLVPFFSQFKDQTE
jgi:secreted Zn-dependent insulinase-like peptidase